mgnify:CR=1 FL=1
MYTNLYKKILAKEEKISLVGLGYVGMPILEKDMFRKCGDSSSKALDDIKGF